MTAASTLRTAGSPANTDAPNPVAGAGSPALDRRGFLKLMMAAGGCLALGIAPKQARADANRPVPSSPPQAFLIISPDNTVTVAVNRTESGQGVSTALPMALADELDADWRNMRTVLAPAGEPYKDPVTGIQMTGGTLFGLAMTKPGFVIDVEHGAARNAGFADYPPVRMQEAPPAQCRQRGLQG